MPAFEEVETISINKNRFWVAQLTLKLHIKVIDVACGVEKVGVLAAESKKWIKVLVSNCIASSFTFSFLTF